MPSKRLFASLMLAAALTLLLLAVALPRCGPNSELNAEHFAAAVREHRAILMAKSRQTEGADPSHSNRTQSDGTMQP
jgi:hypothetical protein